MICNMEMKRDISKCNPHLFPKGQNTAQKVVLHASPCRGLRTADYRTARDSILHLN